MQSRASHDLNALVIHISSKRMVFATFHTRLETERRIDRYIEQLVLAELLEYLVIVPASERR